MLKIDGSYGEGGGQIIRTAIAMSAIVNKPVNINNIRKGRNSPGLKAQHLTSINAAAHICGAKVKGNVLGSTEIEFIPGKHAHGKFQFDVGTAEVCVSFGIRLCNGLPAGCAQKNLKPQPMQINPELPAHLLQGQKRDITPGRDQIKI